jgi:hypothetical protein
MPISPAGTLEEAADAARAGDTAKPAQDNTEQRSATARKEIRTAGDLVKPGNRKIGRSISPLAATSPANPSSSSSLRKRPPIGYLRGAPRGPKKQSRKNTIIRDACPSLFSTFQEGNVNFCRYPMKPTASQLERTENNNLVLTAGRPALRPDSNGQGRRLLDEPRGPTVVCFGNAGSAPILDESSERKPIEGEA